MKAMRIAYALLGVGFAIVFVGIYMTSKPAHAPAFLDETSLTDTSLALTSSAFESGEFIPQQYTCDGLNLNPPLDVSGVPADAQSLVLVMDDPDIPDEAKNRLGADTFDHWVLYNIPVDTSAIDEGGAIGSAGRNSAGDAAYRGPCPPTEYEPTTHRYVFRLYALSGTLNFIHVPSLAEVESAAKERAIAQTEIVGLYSRVGTDE